MVHQHFTLVPSQTVTENVLLGLSKPRFWMRPGRSEDEIGRLAERFGLRVDPRRDGSGSCRSASSSGSRSSSSSTARPGS